MPTKLPFGPISAQPFFPSENVYLKLGKILPDSERKKSANKQKLP